MSIIKVICSDYSNDYCLKNLFTYALKRDKFLLTEESTHVIYGGEGVILNTPETMYHSMMLTKKIYGKEDGVKLHHFIVSIYMNELNAEEMFEEHTKTPHEIVASHMVAICLSEYLFDLNYQNVYFIHSDTTVIHIHFVLNSVRYSDGKKLDDIHMFYNNILMKLMQDYPELKWHNRVIYD